MGGTDRLSLHTFAEMATPFDPPYGGPRWPQTEGWTIRECIVSSTETCIRRSIDTEIERGGGDG